MGATGITGLSLIRWIWRSRDTKLQKQIMLAAIAATIYMIWHVRNVVLWDKKVTNVNSIVNSIRMIVIERVFIVFYLGRLSPKQSVQVPHPCPSVEDPTRVLEVK